MPDYRCSPLKPKFETVSETFKSSFHCISEEFRKEIINFIVIFQLAIWFATTFYCFLRNDAHFLFALHFSANFNTKKTVSGVRVFGLNAVKSLC